jgi:hypothetical protein
MTMDIAEEVKAILQKACDRDWKEETLYQTANIAANAIYWRGREIESLKVQLAKNDAWNLVCPRCGSSPEDACGWPKDCPVGKGESK